MTITVDVTAKELATLNPKKVVIDQADGCVVQVEVDPALNRIRISHPHLDDSVDVSAEEIDALVTSILKVREHLKS